MHKNNVLIILFCLFIMVLGGCSSEGEASQATLDDRTHEFENRIVELEQIVEKQQLAIQEQEEKLTKLNLFETLNENESMPEDFIDMYYSDIADLSDKIYFLDRLVEQITISKTAMLNDVVLQGDTLDLAITYTNLISSDEGPSGFILVETEEGAKVLRIKEDVPIFLLDGPGRLYYATWEEVVERRGFLQLYEKNGEVVFIKELYLP